MLLLVLKALDVVAILAHELGLLVLLRPRQAVHIVGAVLGGAQVFDLHIHVFTAAQDEVLM